MVILMLAGDYLGSRQQHGPNRDWSDAVTEEEEQEQLRHRESSGYRGRRPRYRGGGRGSRREGFNTGSGYRPPQSRKRALTFVFTEGGTFWSAFVILSVPSERSYSNGMNEILGRNKCTLHQEAVRWISVVIWIWSQESFSWMHVTYAPPCCVDTYLVASAHTFIDV